MYYKKCEVCGVRAGREDNIKRKFLAKFPLDENRCKEWVKVIGNEDLAYVPIEKLHSLKYVCGDHFQDRDFNRKKSKLKKTAVPSVCINAVPLNDEILRNFPFHLSSGETVVKSVPVPDSDTTQQPQPSTSTAESELALASTSEETFKRKRISSPISMGNPDLEAELTPRKRKLIGKLKKKNITIKYLQKRAKILDKIQSSTLQSIISSTVQNQDRAPQAKRWSSSQKGLALSIYKKSPKAYRFLENLIPLPSVRTLQIVLQNFKMEPGINKAIMMHLKTKGESMAFDNKLCALLFDEIALKKRLIYNISNDKVDGYEDLGEEGGRTERIADHALVFMLQGIRKKMKQPIAYYFVKGTVSSQKLAAIIKNVIRAVIEAGYMILTTVCDQGPTNIGALNMLKNFSNNSADSNYFLLDDHKVFIIYDVPHLFKSIRNNFLSGGEMMFDNQKAKWAHLIKLEEKNRSTLRFKTISSLHINPKFRTKMKVKLAAQILSNTVAGILKLLSENERDEHRSREILHTAQVIEQLDRLFDCTNGPSSPKDIKKNIRENVSKNSNHHQLWAEYKRKMSTLYFVKSDSQLRLRNVRCIQGYIITISSLQDIWKYVQSKGFKYLNLRQLNQDSLENMFGIIRQHSPTSKNPTCHHFVAALKSAIITKLSTPISRGANCEEDDNKIIFDFHDIIFQNTNKIAHVQEDYLNVQNTEDIPVLHIPEELDEHDTEMEENLLSNFDKQPIVYVSGYLASAIVKKVQCQKCRNSLQVTNPDDNNTLYSYIALREWWKDKKSLTYPTIELCKTVRISTETFEKEVRPRIFQENITHYSVTMMLSTCDISWLCDEHSSGLVQQLLVRLSQLLIRNECQIRNQSFALVEEASADSAKIAQAQGIAK